MKRISIIENQRLINEMPTSKVMISLFVLEYAERSSTGMLGYEITWSDLRENVAMRNIHVS
jgi:hypothetical protein